jgi:hypothetical protein
MKKRPAVIEINRKPTVRLITGGRSWHNGGDIEIYQYAMSLQLAARRLVDMVELENPRSHWADSPIILLYRQALELHLKFLVDAGDNFLKTRVDPISLASTHSLRWLAQITRQIIRKVGCENTFTCEGVASLTDFGAFIEEVESLEPVTRAIRSSNGPSSVSDSFLSFDVVRFARRLDGLLQLLDVTADALAAAWDQRVKPSGKETFPPRNSFKPTIH